MVLSLKMRIMQIVAIGFLCLGIIFLSMCNYSPKVGVQIGLIFVLIGTGMSVSCIVTLCKICNKYQSLIYAIEDMHKHKISKRKMRRIIHRLYAKHSTEPEEIGICACVTCAQLDKCLIIRHQQDAVGYTPSGYGCFDPEMKIRDRPATLICQRKHDDILL